MSTFVYVEKENGDLKLIAEADGDESPELLIDELLDQNPRVKDREFVVVDEDVMAKVTVESDEPVQPRRKITISGTTAKRQSPPKPAAKAKAKPGPKPKAKPGPKPKAKPKAKASAKKGGKSPFKSKSED